MANCSVIMLTIFKEKRKEEKQLGQNYGFVRCELCDSVFILVRLYPKILINHGNVYEKCMICS